MQDKQTTPPVIAPRFGVLVTFMAGVVAITPLGLALAVGRAQPAQRTALTIAVAGAWLLVATAYRGMVRAREHTRRKILRTEIVDARRARLETSDAFQDQLFGQRAIVDRIMEISDRVLNEGITDPQLALNNVRLLQSHAVDAQNSIDDAIIEARVGIGSEQAVFDTINVRDEIEHITAPFARRGINISTAGPTLFGDTDPAMFRMVIRGFILAAITRNAEQVDLSIARNEDVIVCTVSDDGHNCARVGLDAVSALTLSLATSMDSELDYARVLHRNQYSIAIGAAEAPAIEEQSPSPMDVLGSLAASQPRIEAPSDQHEAFSREELIRFVEERERDRRTSVAARRKGQLVR